MRRLIIAFTLIFASVLALDLYPGLRGGGGWRWAYEPPPNLISVGVLALVLMAYVGGVAALRNHRAALRVGWAVVGAVLVTLAVVGVRGDVAQVLLMRTLSPVQTGASTVAVNYMAAQGTMNTLQHWPDVMREALDANIIHFTTSPPGQPLLHHLLAQLLNDAPAAAPLSYALRPLQCANVGVMAYTRGELLSAGMVGLLMPLWAALMAIPVFFAARRLTSSADSAAWMASWTPLLPTVALFMPVWNSLYPALIASSVALLLAGLPLNPTERIRPVWLVGAGAVMSVTTFLNFAVLPGLLVFGLLVLGLCGLRRGVVVGVWFGVGLSLCWLAYWGLSGHTPLDLWHITQEKHSTLVAERDYLAWLILHPYDTLLFIGWPLVGMFTYAVAYAIGRARTPHNAERAPADVLGFAMLITLLAVNVVGIVQGENGRILSFYAPLLLLGAAGMVARQPRGWALPLLAAQALLLGAMASVLAVVPQDLNPPPVAPRADVARLDGLPLNESGVVFHAGEGFYGGATLSHYRYVADVGQQTIVLETVWTGQHRFERPLAFEVVATAFNDVDGHIITPPQRWYAQNGNYPPTCWRPDDVIVDTHILTMPVISAPVVWDLELRLVDERTGEALPPSALVAGIRYP